MDSDPWDGSSSSKKGIKGHGPSGKSKGRPRKVAKADAVQQQRGEDVIDLTLKLCSPLHPTKENASPPSRAARVHCEVCMVGVTPVWRRGPNGPKTLCNACGLRYRRQATKGESAPSSSNGGAA